MCETNPCGTQALSCDCAAILCTSGEICLVDDEGITCGTR
jgi:hypothetical protein